MNAIKTLLLFTPPLTAPRSGLNESGRCGDGSERLSSHMTDRKQFNNHGWLPNKHQNEAGGEKNEGCGQRLNLLQTEGPFGFFHLG